jgi:formate--tetrahydrofolate ligase
VAHDLLAARVAEARDREGLAAAWSPAPGLGRTGESEVATILALARDRADLLSRLVRITAGRSRDGGPVSAGDLGVAGAMAQVLEIAFEPSLRSTWQGTPALVHVGSSAVRGTGCASVVADRVALWSSDLVLSEAAGGAAVGGERFCNVKCRISGIRPDAALLVAPCELPPAELAGPIESLRLQGLPVVVGVVRRPGAAEREVERLCARAREAGALWAHGCPMHGAEGALALARALVRTTEEPATFRFLYPEDTALREKITTVATRVHGAARVGFSAPAERDLREQEDLGRGRLPVVLVLDSPAAARASLSVREIVPATGAGIVIAVAGPA